jgi:hypothetical protein
LHGTVADAAGRRAGLTEGAVAFASWRGLIHACPVDIRDGDWRFSVIMAGFRAGHPGLY